MPGFYSEQRSLSAGISLSRDLAQHIFMRGTKNGVVVVAEKPMDVLSTTKKQWHTLTRQVERERASTLKLVRIAELTNQIVWMQEVQFTSKLESILPENSITFATVEDLLVQAPICSTLYITRGVTAEQFRLMTSWMPENSVVIMYNLKSRR